MKKKHDEDEWDKLKRIKDMHGGGKKFQDAFDEAYRRVKRIIPGSSSMKEGNGRTSKKTNPEESFKWHKDSGEDA